MKVSQEVYNLFSKQEARIESSQGILFGRLKLLYGDKVVVQPRDTYKPRYCKLLTFDQIRSIKPVLTIVG